MASPSITLCMIAKDEADFIDQCIRSVKPVVSEIVLLDTGSTDKTVEIAESHGAKVYHSEWTGDFGAARNISLQYATADWVLILDADEVIAESDLPGLVALTKDRKICWEFLQRHYSNDYRLSNYLPVKGEFPALEKGHAGYFESNLVRLFPNHEGIEYRGKVHELVEHSIKDLGRHTIKRTEIRIHHYGHTEAVKQKKNKGKLYTPLGKAKVVENPNDWKNQFELGVEHNNNGMLEESEQAFIRSTKLNPGYLSTWVNLGYVQCELKKYPEAVESLKMALRVDPRSEEAYCNLGVIFMRIPDLPKAEWALRQAIGCAPQYINAYNNLAIVLGQTGRLSEAAQILFRMREIFPASPHAVQRLVALYQAVGLNDVAGRFAKSLDT